MDCITDSKDINKKQKNSIYRGKKKIRNSELRFSKMVR